MTTVNLAETFARFDEPWSPRIDGELNGQHVRLVKLRGEFIWHWHGHEDEMFLVVKGRFRMEFRERHIWLEAGEFLIVPRGVEYRPVADEEAHVLLFEPDTTLNTRNVRDKRTVESPRRISEMPGILNKAAVIQRLADLDRRDRGRQVFGASSRQYRLNPPLPGSVIEGFEGRHGVSVPEDYRRFITEIGDGGAGPPYDLLPFGKDDDDRDWEVAGWSATPPGRSRTRPPGTCPGRSGTASPIRPPTYRWKRRTGSREPGTGRWRRTTGTRRSWTGRSRSAIRAVRCANGWSSTARRRDSSGTTSGPTTPGSLPSWASRAGR